MAATFDLFSVTPDDDAAFQLEAVTIDGHHLHHFRHVGTFCGGGKNGHLSRCYCGLARRSGTLGGEHGELCDEVFIDGEWQGVVHTEYVFIGGHFYVRLILDGKVHL